MSFCAKSFCQGQNFYSRSRLSLSRPNSRSRLTLTRSAKAKTYKVKTKVKTFKMCPRVSSKNQETSILNSHRVIGIATNTLMVLNCALVNECSLPSYPGQRDPQTPHSVGLHERYLTNQLPTSLAYSEGLLSWRLYTMAVPSYFLIHRMYQKG